MLLLKKQIKSIKTLAQEGVTKVSQIMAAKIGNYDYEFNKASILAKDSVPTESDKYLYRAIALT